MISEKETGTSEKEQLLLDAALELFADHGFDATSVRMIAEKAGMNVAMISYYFGSKEKLLEELLIRKTQYIREQIDALAADSTLDEWYKFESLISSYVDRIMTSGGLFHKLMMRELSLGVRVEITSLIEKRITYNMNAINQLIVAGQQHGIFKDNIDFGMLMGMIIGTITQATMSSGLMARLSKFGESDTPIKESELRNRVKSHLKLVCARYMLISPEQYNYN